MSGTKHSQLTGRPDPLTGGRRPARGPSCRDRSRRQPAVYTGDVNGTQRWVAMDQSMVQFRAAKGTLTFHAWKRTHFPAYWSMGASVTADGLNYDAGIIDSHYYMTVPEGTGCELVKAGESTDHDNNYFDEWQWGVNSQQPDRVARVPGAVERRPVRRPGHRGQRMQRL